MKHLLILKWWTTAVILLFLIALSAGVIFAQAEGTIIIEACVDQNADGDCEDEADGPAPPDLEACLDDETNCQPVPATFDSLSTGSYTPFLRFVGASQGYYPTTFSPPVDLAQGEQLELTLGAVYPVHPKGVAVHEGLNKVYVAFQGPVAMSVATTAMTDTTSPKPYPFVAVIDGSTDQVLGTIPGGDDGIGREPWGVAVSGDNVYVGSFGEGRVSVIDAETDTVIVNIEPDHENFRPTAPAVNPTNGWVHFPDYGGGRVVMIDGTDIAAAPIIANQFGFSPFEMVVADAMQGYNYFTMRDAINEAPFQFRGLNSAEPFGVDARDIAFTGQDGLPASGSPHAIGLWQDEDMAEPRFFLTYAGDERGSSDAANNPNKLLVYSFPVVDPKNALLRNSEVEIGGDYAEVGLIYNDFDADDKHMLGTYAGFAYDDSRGDEAACDFPGERGGTYRASFDGQISAGPLPDTIVGNPPLSSGDGGGALQWKNPFELALNSSNGKIYVTDRCWNDYEAGGQAGGGAVLVIGTTAITEPTPTPTSTVETATLAFLGPELVSTGETFSVTVQAQGVGGDGLYGVQLEINFDPALISAGNLQVSPDLPFAVIQEVDNDAGKISVVASRQGNVPGLTGDVDLLTFEATTDDTTGMATFTFSNEKIGDVNAEAFDLISESYTVLIEVDVTPTPETPTATPETPTTTPETPTSTPETPTATPETPTATPETPTATPETPTATPTTTPETPTATPETPTATPETPTATPETPTATPETPTSTPETPTTTPETPTATPGTPTATPETPTATPETPTVTPETPTSTPETPTATPGTPTSTPETPTATPETPTATSTTTPETPTATPGTPTVTPETPTPTATPDLSSATVLGQVILAGRAGNDWSDAVVTIDDTDQSAITDINGNFAITEVATGTLTSITADAAGYLSAICTAPEVTAPETNLLSVSLVGGDITDDDVVDVADATAVGISFGQTGPDVPADLNRDGAVDILDIILVGVNFGRSGPQDWTCQ